MPRIMVQIRGTGCTFQIGFTFQVGESFYIITTHRIRMYAIYIYMVTLTINVPQMLAYIPYMDPMGNKVQNTEP